MLKPVLISVFLSLCCLLQAAAPDYYERAEKQYYDADYSGAITTALEGLAQKDVTPEDEVEFWSVLGSSYARLGAFDKAAEYMILCYDYDKANGDAKGLTSSLINLASMYVYAGNPQLAEDYALEAIENERSIGRPDKLAMAYGKACDVYHALGQDTTALHYADLAVELSEVELDRSAQAVRRSQRAYPLEALERYRQALADLTFAESVFRETGARQSLSIVCFQLAQEYGRQGRDALERQYLLEAADMPVNSRTILFCRKYARSWQLRFEKGSLSWHTNIWKKLQLFRTASPGVRATMLWNYSISNMKQPAGSKP